MPRAEFLSGLSMFSERHARVQSQLHEIERSGLRPKQVDRYRDLLDEIISIGFERAQYCARMRKHEQPTPPVPA